MPNDNDGPLKSTAWLAAHLDDANLRLFDCTSFLIADPSTTFRVESGRADWARAHIPGANHLALQDDLSDPASPLRFTMPAAPDLAERLGRLGVDDASVVVLYSSTHYMWAARVWWMLSAIGFGNAFVLDGGLVKWRTEGRPTSDTERRYPPGSLTARSAPGSFVPKLAVLGAIGDGDTILVNALPAAQYRGETGHPHHGRPGHIRSSINLPALSLLSPSGAMRSRPELQAMLDASGIERDKSIICYCGGGVSAACVALALTLCGYPRIAVYDGSLNEWAQDDSLPMESG